MRKPSIKIFTLSVFACMFYLCSDPRPLVEDLISGEPTSYSLVRFTGERDGYYLSGELELKDSSGEDIWISLNLEIGVPSRLLSGSWTSMDDHGSIIATSVEFFGGQGGAPSLGGTFLLVDDTSAHIPSYRLNLPKSEIETRRMQLQGI